MTIHCPDALQCEIAEAAAAENRSVSSFAAEAIRHYIHEKKKRNAVRQVARFVQKRSHAAGNALLELSAIREDTNDRP